MTDHPEIIKLAHVLCEDGGAQCGCKGRKVACGIFKRHAGAAMRFCYSRPVTERMLQGAAAQKGLYSDKEAYEAMAAARLKELGLDQ